jgi:PhoPQ-activated pathogenicity-related protein
MHSFFQRLKYLFSLGLCCAALVAATNRLWAEDHLVAVETPLDHYVAQPDSSYSWNLASTVPGSDLTTYAIDMTSQTWRPENTDHPQWKHRIFIVKPKEVEYDTAFLYITGGSNRGEPPTLPDVLTAMLARETKSVVAELRMIPNQPLVFNGDGIRRSEDDLIAYTWDKVITTGDPTWSARLPMVKASVRAMDTIQAFLASAEGGKLTINKFLVAGGSKRGWTTWLVGAVDNRVAAIVPAVIDVLNVQDSMTHHFECYGFWAEAVGDYVRHKIMEKRNHPGYAALLKFEDPYNYLNRLTMPKFVVNAAGDQFFCPTSSQFYWDKLQGEKYLRYVANAGHSLDGSDAPQSIEAFYVSILRNSPRPKFNWTFEPDGSIRVKTRDKPKEVKLWQATNPEARDFRVSTIGRAYKSSPVEAESEGVYIARASPPPQGFTAYFVELTFDSGFKHPFKFTTGVRVTPDELPFKGKLQQAAGAAENAGSN